MRLRTLLVGALVPPLALAGRSAFGWNATGHELVALIAWDHLSRPQREAFTRALGAHPRYQKDLLQGLQPGENPDEHAFRDAATWPDVVKGRTHPLERTEDHKNWHYVDYPFDEDGKAGPLPPEAWDGRSTPTDLLQAMQMVTAQLRDPATPPPRVAIALCWVLHLVGDAHQPLHDVSLFSKDYPTGDQGGNLIHIRADTFPDFNLHGYWDGLEGRSLDPTSLRRNADRIEKEHPYDAATAELAETDPKAWAQESFDLAKHDAYLDGHLHGVTPDQALDKPDAIPPLPPSYGRTAHDVADQQIALAGYRLANLLRSLPLAGK